MKRLLYASEIPEENILKLSIHVHYYRDSIECASILDIKDPAFQAFELDVLEACDIHNFELIKEEESPIEGSISRYYTYVKTNKEGTRLLVYLKIRISDHTIDDDPERKISSYKKRDEKYVKREAQKYAETYFNQPRGYRARRLDIVFNDEHYTSYWKALNDIEDQLDIFDPE